MRQALKSTLALLGALVVLSGLLGLTGCNSQGAPDAAKDKIAKEGAKDPAENEKGTDNSKSGQ